jgi:hypothetical protein
LFSEEDALYPSVKGAKLYHNYEYLTRRQKRDLINSTRYVGKLMEDPEHRKTLDYLTWKDFEFANCLRTEWGPQCDNQMISHLRDIDTIFQKAPRLSEDLVIFRGVRDFIPLEDQSYTFTTPNRPFAETFMRNNRAMKKFLLRLTIPKGTPILSYGLLNTHDVDEVILPRGGKFHIKNMETDVHGYMVGYVVADVEYEYVEHPKGLVQYENKGVSDITEIVDKLLGGGRRS